VWQVQKSHHFIRRSLTALKYTATNWYA
jgi:hypothetical protein